MIYSTAGEAVTRRVQQFRSKSSTVKSIWYWWRELVIILRRYPLEVEELQELKKSQRTVLYLFWEKDEEDDGQGCKALSRKP